MNKVKMDTICELISSQTLEERLLPGVEVLELMGTEEERLEVSNYLNEKFELYYKYLLDTKQAFIEKVYNIIGEIEWSDDKSLTKLSTSEMSEVLEDNETLADILYDLHADKILDSQKYVRSTFLMDHVVDGDLTLDLYNIPTFVQYVCHIDAEGFRTIMDKAIKHCDEREYIDSSGNICEFGYLEALSEAINMENEFKIYGEIISIYELLEGWLNLETLDSNRLAKMKNIVTYTREEKKADEQYLSKVVAEYSNHISSKFDDILEFASKCLEEITWCNPGSKTPLTKKVISKMIATSESFGELLGNVYSNEESITRLTNMNSDEIFELVVPRFRYIALVDRTKICSYINLRLLILSLPDLAERFDIKTINSLYKDDFEKQLHKPAHLYKVQNGIELTNELTAEQWKDLLGNLEIDRDLSNDLSDASNIERILHSLLLGIPLDKVSLATRVGAKKYIEADILEHEEKEKDVQYLVDLRINKKKRKLAFLKRKELEREIEISKPQIEYDVKLKLEGTNPLWGIERRFLNSLKSHAKNGKIPKVKNYIHAEKADTSNLKF